jgi:hypothetical protein
MSAELITIALLVGIVAIALRSIAPTACTGDCDQGRNCTCGDD